MLKNRLLSWLTVIFFSIVLIGCSDKIESVETFNSDSKPPIPNVENIAEVATPSLIAQLNENFAQTQPQVKIISPQNDEILNTDTVSVSLDVKGFETFKNEELKMGPHLHFLVDDQPYRAIYDTTQSIELKELTPGTHTIRVFASRPWHESFKNEGAYAQTTFHLFTPTENNNPSSNQPLLTYSRPEGVYSAEPIMLDFYLTNTPLHEIATENKEDDITDWRIRVTINGESFLLDTWQPIYLTGFKKGKNWVKLEFIDENGNVVKNAFNSTVRVIDYQPKNKDTLAKLVTNKISLAKAQAITKKDSPVIVEEEIIQEEEVIVEETTPEVVTPQEDMPSETKIESEEKPKEEETPLTSEIPKNEVNTEMTETEKQEGSIEETITEESITLEKNSATETPISEEEITSLGK